MKRALFVFVFVVWASAGMVGAQSPDAAAPLATQTDPEKIATLQAAVASMKVQIETAALTATPAAARALRDANRAGWCIELARKASKADALWP